MRAGGGDTDRALDIYGRVVRHAYESEGVLRRRNDVEVSESSQRTQLAEQMRMSGHYDVYARPSIVTYTPLTHVWNNLRCG